MKSIIITISEKYLNDINSIAVNLKKDGLIIQHVFEFGVIIGTADDEIIEKLRIYREIISITEDKPATIGPPDSEVQ